MMDLESGDTIYVEAVIGGAIRLSLYKAGSPQGTSSRLTTEQARTLANALLGAVVEADAHQPR